jgi:small GTP-binding protein
MSTPIGLKHELTIGFHQDFITELAWHPDGELLASASADGSIKVWDYKTGSLARTLEVGAGVSSISWSPDGTWVASVSLDKRLIVWLLATGARIQMFDPDLNTAWGVSWAPTGKHIATAHRDGFVYLWQPPTPRPCSFYRKHSRAVSEVAWSPDGSMLASAGRDGMLGVWHPTTGEFRSLHGHVGPIWDVLWSQDSKTIISSGADRAIVLWNAESGKVVQKMEGHTDTVVGLNISSDGRLLASSQRNGFNLWILDPGTLICSVNLGSGPQRIAFHPTRPLFASLGETPKQLQIWSVDTTLLTRNRTRPASVRYVSAKIALVGESGVGKTGVAWRVAHGGFREHASTHGQQNWVIDDLGLVRSDGTECEVILWDLAGQPDYRLVNCLALEDVDLALLVCDASNRDTPLRGIDRWLRQLRRSTSHPCPTILVCARADRGEPAITHTDLDEFCKSRGIEGGFVITSALTGEGIHELLQNIRGQIDWEVKPATITTHLFKVVREAVLRIASRNALFLGATELRAEVLHLYPHLRFSDDELMAAVRNLAKHGHALVLQRSTGAVTFLVVPKILYNLGASLVLEARRDPRGLGTLDEARLQDGGFQFPETTELDPADTATLIDAAIILLVRSNICFRETAGHDRVLVFPSLINLQRPFAEDQDVVDDVWYSVTGPVENVYAALVVLLGYTNTFTRTNQWQNQAQYEMRPGEICGFRQTEEQEGKVELVLYYSKSTLEPSRMLFQGLFEHFLHRRGVSVTRYAVVICPNCGEQQDRGAVARRVKEGASAIFCSKCGNRMDIAQAGERSRSSSVVAIDAEHAKARTRFEAALVHLQRVISGKKTPTCFISYAWGSIEHERWVSTFAADLEIARVEVLFDRTKTKIGSSVPRFIERMLDCDFAIVVGTPSYLEKAENRATLAGTKVAAESDLLQQWLTGTEEEKSRVLPLLREGTYEQSLPRFLRGRVYADFRKDGDYFRTLLEVVLTIHR